MSKGLKIFLFVLAAVSTLAFLAFMWGKSVWDKISFGKPRITGLDFNNLSLIDLANIAFTGGQQEVTANIGIDIANQNSFAIPFSSLKVKLLYNDEVIGQTSDMLAQKQSVPANGTLPLNDTVKIILNNAGAQLLTDKIKNGKATLQYKIMVKVFGIPLPKGLQTHTLDI